MVVPRPASLVALDGPPFVLAPGARISVAGEGADDVARLLRAELATDCRRELSVVHEPPIHGDIAIVIAPDEAPDGATDEGYTLEVAAEGVRIGAATAAGAFWGVQSLRQLIPVECTGDPLTIAPLRIRDSPRFAYRGVMLDVARHFFTPAEVRRFIDAIVQLKVNHLHLHLTDDQGWRIEILSRPALTAVGASSGSDGSEGGYFTQQEYVDLVGYAAERQVTIVPEIDMPGHTNAALASYPVLNADGVAPALYTGSAVGFSTLLTDDAETERFLDDVIGEVAALTPGPYLHIGGDEALSTRPADYLRFIARATAIVSRHGKIPVGWHELGRSDELPPGTIGQYWDFVTPRGTSEREALSFVRQGGQVIMSPADATYLDIVYAHGDRVGQEWTGGPTTLRAAFQWDPARIVPGLGDAHIRGVEAPLWTETVATIDEVEEMVFPRLAAVAEVGWSPAPADTEPVDAARDFEDFADRVAALADHWDAAGTRYRLTPDVPWREPLTA